MTVKHFLLEVNEVNAFVVACDDSRAALLIDAGVYDAKIVHYLKSHNLRLDAVLITHDHFDHTSGLPEFVRHFHPMVYAPAESIEGCQTTLIQHDDEIKIGNLIGRIFETPGHTPFAASIYFPGHIFTGDALFAGSVGGTSSKSDADRQLAAIRKHIFTLPPDTLVHVGHGPSSTVAIESRHNPFFN